jgi:hypothetical protein
MLVLLWRGSIIFTMQTERQGHYNDGQILFIYTEFYKLSNIKS